MNKYAITLEVLKEIPAELKYGEQWSPLWAWISQKAEENRPKTAEEKLPAGYVFVQPGEIIAEGALWWEPCHGNWMPAGNSVGHPVNNEGYCEKYVHRGWRFANPVAK